ncbi:Winged helix-turn-helix DNA-binding domain [Phaffia rhodozyma]|uniref:Winged helix-turn-helix DNA-binding domain n=1 Tax=Phaffia rhodozyma TaxID=264483 RepID=A0A0F7SNV8_PHARH|nr:Winged helix-turn-helix DNA-binding domain [Phaffia rhodozyma]
MSFSHQFIHDLFSTLLISLNLKSNRQFFKIYPDSFTSDDALTNVASLRFSQSIRLADSNPGKHGPRIKTTTTTTTFSMTKDAAKGVLQQMVDARLMENAADLSSTRFRERAVWVLSPKGLDVLERFIARQGIHTPYFTKLCSTYPAGPQPIIYLERHPDDDMIVSENQPMIEEVFRRFVGQPPKTFLIPRTPYQYPSRASTFLNKPSNMPGKINRRGSFSSDLSHQSDLSQTSYLHSLNPDDLVSTPGISLQKNKAGTSSTEYCFNSISALDWLCDFTSSIGYAEAGQLAALWVKLGWIICVTTDVKGRDVKKTERPYKITTRKKNMSPEGIYRTASNNEEFRASEKTVYKITSAGTTLAWRTERARSSLSPGYFKESVISSTLISTAESDQTANKLSSERSSEHQHMATNVTTSLPPLHQTESSETVLPLGNPIKPMHETTTRAALVSTKKLATASLSKLPSGTLPIVNETASIGQIAPPPNLNLNPQPVLPKPNKEGSKTRYIPFSRPGTRDGVSIAQTLKDSRAAKLSRILKEPALRGLFREFMRLSFCEENLNFWCDVEDFKERYRMTSSAEVGGTMGAVVVAGYGSTRGRISEQMAAHQQKLLELAIEIYTTYLTPRSKAEINVPSSIKKDIASYFLFVRNNQPQPLQSSQRAPSPAPGFMPVGVAGQLQKIISLFEEAQKSVFEGMATDSLPKFAKDDRIARVLRSAVFLETPSYTTTASSAPPVFGSRSVTSGGHNSRRTEAQTGRS